MRRTSFELPSACPVLSGCPGGASEVRSYAGFRLRSPSQPLGVGPLGLRWASKLHHDLLVFLPIRPFDAAAALQLSHDWPPNKDFPSISPSIITASIHWLFFSRHGAQVLSNHSLLNSSCGPRLPPVRYCICKASGLGKTCSRPLACAELQQLSPSRFTRSELLASLSFLHTSCQTSCLHVGDVIIT